jgi:hypothetical protein
MPFQYSTSAPLCRSIASFCTSRLYMQVLCTSSTSTCFQAAASLGVCGGWIWVGWGVGMGGEGRAAGNHKSVCMSFDVHPGQFSCMYDCLLLC